MTQARLALTVGLLLSIFIFATNPEFAGMTYPDRIALALQSVTAISLTAMADAVIVMAYRNHKD